MFGSGERDRAVAWLASLRRARIFEAALAIFAELGYDRATLNDVMDRIGFGPTCRSRGRSS